MEIKFNLITDKGKKIPADTMSLIPVLTGAPPEDPDNGRCLRRVMFRGEPIDESEILALIEAVIIRAKYRHKKSKAVEVVRGRFEMDHTYSKTKHMEAEDTITMDFRIDL